MHILGLSFGFHDSSAALISDGQVVAACQQERFSRIKNDSGFPYDAALHCLERAGLAVSDIDIVVYYEQPLLKFDRIVKNWKENGKETNSFFESTVARWLRESRFDIPGLIAERLGIDVKRVCMTHHHLSHAASAFYLSPFREAAIVTLDGVGEYETASTWRGEDKNMVQLSSVELPHSIGLFYSAFTAFLGFRVNEGEYKVMGMAAFGQPRFRDQIRSLIELNDDGTFTLDQSLFNFSGMSDRPYNAAMTEAFGEPRVEGSPFGIDQASLPSDLPLTGQSKIIERSRYYADIAASVQAVTEEAIVHMVLKAASQAKTRQVCMAGGVALNSLANGILRRDHDVDLFIQPAAGDAGTALGAAAYIWHERGGDRLSPMASGALGRDFNREEIKEAIAASGFSLHFEDNDTDNWVEATAGLLADGQVLGWFEGRAEWGPRALGHRSILADPRDRDMQRVVNEKVKFREPFRPFAPAVVAERAQEFFDMGPENVVHTPSSPEAFMLAVHPVREAYRSRLPAITHADGTARVQMVHKEHHPLFHALLVKFGEKSGLPVLMNTSFNLNGEPIVDTPQDAIRTFSLCGLDYLSMGGFVISQSLTEPL